MTEQNIPDLIAEARKLDYPYDWENMVERLADALEAVTAERDELKVDLETKSIVHECCEKAQERDELAAVVERMKQSEHYRLTESERKRFGEGNGCVCPMCSALNAAPSVALDRVKAQAWDEGCDAGVSAFENGGIATNPYRAGADHE